MSTVRFSRFTVIVLVVVIAVSIIAAILVAPAIPDQDLRKSLYTALLALIGGAILGGLAKLLLDDFDRGRQQRAEYAQFITNVLADLKGVYDQVERARTLLAANRSAKTFGEQMRDLIEARVKLLNVIRALEQDQDALKRWGQLQGDVRCMKDYLTWLIEAFQREYKVIADLQRLHEARVNATLELLKNDPKGEVQPLENKPWKELCKLKEVRDFIGANSCQDGQSPEPGGYPSPSDYDSKFLKCIDKATGILREELSKILD
jgi:hypothetical protein